MLGALFFLFFSTAAMAFDHCKEQFSSECIPLTTEAFEEIGKNSDPRCIVQSNEFVPPVPQFKCDELAKTLCDPSINPHLQKPLQVFHKFETLITNAYEKPNVKSFIKNIDPNFKSCRSLSKPDSAKCNKMVNKIISKGLYTKDRMSAAQNIFDESKASILAVLNKRRTLLGTAATQEQLKTLKEMELQIKKANLVFSPFEPDVEISMNARVNFQIEGTSNYKASARNKNNVYIEGLLLFADTNPEQMRFILLHELSHFIDSRVFYEKDPSVVSHPFRNEIQCLKREDSVAAQGPDLACFDLMTEKYKTTHPDYSREAAAVAKNIRRNPHQYWMAPKIPSWKGSCQLGQMPEAYSDWLATEAYVETLKPLDDSDDKNLLQNLAAITEMTSVFCENYQENDDLASARKSYLDSHPLQEDRIKGIFLAHPLIKKSLGCTEENSLINLHAPSSLPKRVYCGEKLFRRKGPL